MITRTDGIILRQTKIADDRRMLTLLTRQFGKISAGAGVGSGKRSRSQLAIKAFTHGQYEIYTGRSSYSINSAETLESFYDIGTDVEKFAVASYALELTDRMLAENVMNEEALELLLNFLRLLVRRQKAPETLLSVYKWKLLGACGYAPITGGCVLCGSRKPASSLSVVDGGVICEECRNTRPPNMRLIYDIGFDIIRALEYIQITEFDAFEKLVLNKKTSDILDRIFRDYISYHLEIDGLKSEAFLKI